MLKAACPGSFESLQTMNVSWHRLILYCPGIFSFSPWMTCSILEPSLACSCLTAVAQTRSAPAQQRLQPWLVGMSVLPPHRPRSQELSSVSSPQPACEPRPGPRLLGEDLGWAPTLQSPEGQIAAGTTSQGKPPARNQSREMLLLAGLKKEEKERERENSNELISCSKTFSPLCSCF